MTSRDLLPLTVLALGSPALAQEWRVVVLHPPGAMFSEVNAVSGTRQAGSITWATGTTEAGTWLATSSSWMSLPAPIGGPGYVFGMDERRLVGYSAPGAAIWNSTSGTYVNMHPEGAFSSSAHATHGNLQVGIVGFASIGYHAALWRGTRKSFVDLHPPGAVHSYALATDGVLQGGYSEWPGMRATLWIGTPESFIILSTMPSKVSGMAPGVQVGEVIFPQGGTAHAALWSGTPQSFVDLNPVGASTRLYATTGRVHVGQGILVAPGVAHAVINFGTVDSWLDLHQFLPPQYTTFSAAKAVHQEGDTLYVGGYAEDGHNHAILWIGKVPCYPNCDGSSGAPMLSANDFLCFINEFASGSPIANCDGSSGSPALTANDFMCFLNRYAAGCT